jgi:hypothetical protein
MTTTDFTAYPWYQELMGFNYANMETNREVDLSNQQNQMDMLQAQLAYNRERMRLLEIPEMQLSDERERHALALQYVSQLAEQSGWVISLDNLDFLYNPDNSRNGPNLPSTQDLMKGAVPTVKMQELMGNPRNLAQSLIGIGLSGQEAGNVLRMAPLTQQLAGGYQGVAFNGGASGRNPDFPFVSGNQMANPQQVLRWKQSGDNRLPLTESLASFSGQSPDSFWGSFGASTPKGQRLNPTRYA